MKVRNSPSVFIIILNWNGFEDTVSCINSLSRIDYSNSQIVLVDNGSKNEEADRLKSRFSHIVVISNNENLGFTGGCNVGINYALEKNAEYILLLNNDTIVTASFLTELVESIEEKQEVAAAQPKINFEHQRNLVWNGGSGFNYIFCYPKFIGMRELDNGQFDAPELVPWLTGCCMLVKSEVIREVGVLDEAYFAYYEDTDWSFRMRNLGYKLLYEPSSLIYHKVARSQRNMEKTDKGDQSPFIHYISMRNHILFIKRHALKQFLFSTYLYIVLKMLAYSGYFILRKRFTKLCSIWQGFFDGLNGTRFRH